jgi:hypothetical protein
MHAALGVRIFEFSLPEMRSWLEGACRCGSITALQDLETLFGGIDTSPTTPGHRVTLRPCGYDEKDSGVALHPLHAAVLAGDVVITCAAWPQNST